MEVEELESMYKRSGEWTAGQVYTPPNAGMRVYCVQCRKGKPWPKSYAKDLNAYIFINFTAQAFSGGVSSFAKRNSA